MGQLSNAAQSALCLAQKGVSCCGCEGPGLDSCHGPLWNRFFQKLFQKQNALHRFPRNITPWLRTCLLLHSWLPDSPLCWPLERWGEGKWASNKPVFPGNRPWVCWTFCQHIPQNISVLICLAFSVRKMPSLEKLLPCQLYFQLYAYLC